MLQRILSARCSRPSACCVALSSLSAVLLVHAISLSAAETRSDYEATLRANAEQISHLDAELSAARQRRESLVSRLKTTDGKIKGRQLRIKELGGDIRRYEREVSALESTLQNSQELINRTRTSLGRLMLTSLQVRSNDGVQIMLQHTDPAMSSRVGVYYDYFFRAAAARIEAEAALLMANRQARDEALKSRNWLNYLKKKAGAQQQNFSGSRQAGQTQLKKLENSLQSKQQRVSALHADQERLALLLQELRKQSLGASGQFSQGKGKYPWPTAGKLHAGFGDAKSIGKLTWNGLFIDARPGTAVRAIADGETVYADWLQGFGQLVIIDHGDGFMTLYGGNRDLAVTTGDWVEFGAGIATVGESRGLNRTGLYFEIRHNARPIDPEIWIDSENRFEDNV